MMEYRPEQESSDLKVLLQRLVDGHGYLVESGREWCLFSRRNAYARPLDRVAPATVKALLAKGHLVERAGGGVEPLAARQAASGRFSDQRPLPDDMAATPRPRVNDAESPLAWLNARKDRQGRPLISPEQFMAGERLRGDYERSCMAGRVTANWDFSVSATSKGGGTAAHLSDSALTARQQVHGALDAVGPELASILVQVCCLSAGIEQAERLLDLPQRSGKAVLGLALTALARHYGFLRQAGRGKSRSGHWALPGYRPDIPAAEER